MRRERHVKQNRFYESSANRNESWNKLAQERILTEKVNRKRQLQQSKSTVIIKIKSEWPENKKIEDVSFIDFVHMMSGMQDEQSVIRNDFIFLETSLNGGLN